MTKIEQMRRALSAEALAALAHSRFDYPGAAVQISNPIVMTELRREGVVGDNDGLTIVGSGLAAKVQAELLDSLF